MTALTLVRHGQSRWNVEGRIQGQTDVPLSALGEQQAEAVGARLAGTRVDAVYASPLRRAFDTAGAIARHHRVDVRIVAALTEIHHGEWQGLTEAEIAEADGDRLRLWNLLPGRVQMPGGERLFDVRQRALQAAREIVAAHAHGAVVVVTHDVVVRVIVAEILGLDYDHLARLVVNNTGLTVIEYDGGAGRILTLNDTAHLTHLRDGQTVE